MIHLPTVPVPTTEPVSCAACVGACCLHVGHPVWCPGEGRELLPPDLLAELDAYRAWLARQPEDWLPLAPAGDDYGLPCIWLDPVSRRCLHYEHRPPVCREFEVGGEDCLALRRQLLGERT